MKYKKFLAPILILLLFLPLITQLIPITPVYAEPPQDVELLQTGETGIVGSERSDPPEGGWVQFWDDFKLKDKWDLEWYDVEKEKWVKAETDLSVTREYPLLDTCKITLDFIADAEGSYRLNYKINLKVKKSEGFSSKYYLTFEDFRITFDWSDALKERPKAKTERKIKENKFEFSLKIENVTAGEHVIIDPRIVGDSTTLHAVSSPYINKGFYAAGLAWTFWSNGTGGAPDGFYYSSLNGTTWAEPTFIRTGYYKGDFVYNGTHVHYAYGTPADNKLYYRVGVPAADGVITWDEVEQEITTTNTSYRATIAVDTDGYPWIFFINVTDDSEQHPYVITSTERNGTWVTKAGYPLELDDTVFGAELIGNIIPLTDGKIYITWHNNYASGADLPIFGKLYDGSSWSTRENVTSTWGSDSTHCLTNVNDNVYVAYLPKTTGYVVFVERDYDSEEWGSEVTVYTSGGNPDMTADTDGTVYVWFGVGTDINYKKLKPDGTWSGLRRILSNTNITSSGHLSAWLYTYGGYLGLIYTAYAPSPYYVMTWIGKHQENDWDWYDDNFAYRTPLWFDAREITGGLNNFVAKVHMDNTNTDWTLFQNDGDDVRFTDKFGIHEYKYDLSSWDDGEDAFFWVKVPFIPELVATDYMWMYYGNPSVAGAEEPELVWIEYVLVHHLEEASGTIYDETSIDNDGTNAGSWTYNQPSMIGVCGKGGSIDGGYLIVDQAGTVLDFGEGAFTVEVLTKGNADMPGFGDESPMIYAKGDSGGDWELSLTDDDGEASFWIMDGANQPTATGTTDLYTNNQGWVYLTGVRDVPADKIRVYVNGTEEAVVEDTAGSIRNNPDYGFYDSETGGTQSSRGYLDEVRITNMTRSSEYIEATYMNLFDEFVLFSMVNIEVTILNMEGCGTWVFADEKYYDFQAVARHPNGTDLIYGVEIAFTDGVNWINASYDHVEEAWNLTSGSEVAILKSGTTTTVDDIDLYVVFPLYFRSNIFDALDVDIYLQAYDINGVYCYWSLVSVGYFNIYNLGGQAELTSSGEAGRIDSGDVIELYAYNNSWAQANVMFRKLQGVHLYVRLHGNKEQWDGYEGDPWNITFGMYVCPDNEEWIEGWKVVLNLNNITKSWVLYPDYYLTWNASWYYRTSGSSGWQIQETDIISSYPVWNKSQGEWIYTSFWVDFWFNKINASTTVGGRVNAENFGVKRYEKSAQSPTGWMPYIGNTTQSMFFHDLENTAGEVISSRQLKMMKFFVRAEQGINSARNNSIEMRDYDIFDWKITKSGMEGIDTPVFVATKMPDMPSTGFLMPLINALSTALSGVVKALTTASLTAWNLFVLFLDSVGAWLGFPNMFSNFISYIGDLFSYIGLAMANMGTMLTQIFNFFTGPILLFLGYIGRFFTTILTTFSRMIAVFQAVVINGENFLDYFDNFIPDLITLFFVMGVPIYMLNVFKEEGLYGTWKKINQVMDVLMYFINLFLRVLSFVIGLISQIIEAVPVVE